MENNPDMESFERFIKQHSDDFRMYPTKRVWYSLYNNLHPSRKWPSISMCIVLLTILFLVGFLNTNNNHNSVAAGEITKNTDWSISNTPASVEKDKIISIQNTTLTKASTAKNDATVVGENTYSNPEAKSANTNKLQSSVLIAAQQQKIITPKALRQTAISEAAVTTQEVAANNSTEEVTTPSNEADKVESAPSDINNTVSVAENSLEELKKLPATLIEYNTSRAAETAISGGTAISEEMFNKNAVGESDAAAKKIVVTSLTDKSWIENYALYNKPAPKRWKGKMAWQAYFTPSVTYRKLFNNAAGKNIANSVIGSTDASLSKEVTQSASIGLEGGIGLQYPILKGIKIKAGVQLNYTRYNISAFENSHPTITSLEMISEFNGKPYELYKTTAYSNNSGLVPVTLHSQTFQLSLPVGADIKLAGNDLFEWYAGAAIQPTLVFAASSFLVSTDRRNYVKDRSMLNHFNMNAAFETYISFKSAGGLTWQIGPQLRKQLYSTSTKFYTVEERLMGYGLKVGFIKKL